MSTKTPAGLQDAGTTDDAPTLEPDLTTIVTETTANGREGDILDYEQFASTVTCLTDTVHRLVEDSR